MTGGGRTEEIAATDAYARSTDAVVTEVRPEGVVLDRTVFYARGGGQQGDTGWLRWEGGECRVTDTVRAGGEPVHVVEGEPPEPGTEVHAEIDWDRRHLLMRSHTALHALSGIIWRDYGAKVTGGNISQPGEARMDFELDAMSGDFGREVESKLNEALAAGRPVNVLFMPRSEALADPDLIRTKVSLIPETVDPIRVIDIEGIDRQADGGTHVRSTSEVGRVQVVKTESKGKAFKRMRIALSD
ncbi:MAG TPA: alanyl-tRNA editing protein [Actinomycetota bacterium]